MLKRLLLIWGGGILWIVFAAGILFGQQDTENTKNSNTITAVVLRDMRPNSFVNPSDQKVYGYAIDISNAIAKKHNLKVNYILVNDWQEVEKYLREGRADFCPVLAITESRKKEFLLSEPVESFSISICVRRQNKDIKDTISLSGKTAGVIKASAAYHVLKSLNNIKIVEFESFQSAIFDLLAGHIDAFVAPENVINNTIIEAEIDNSLKIIPNPIAEFKRAFAFPQNKIKLYSQLNITINEFISTPEYKKIYTHWFLPPKAFWTIKRILIWAGGFFFFIILIFLFFYNRAVLKINLSLNRALKEKNIAHQKLEESLRQIQNINARLEEAKEIAEKSEQFYKEAVIDLKNAQSYSKIGSWKWFIQEGKLEWSDEMYNIFGIDKSEFTNTLPEIIKQSIHPDDRAKVEASNLSVIEKGSPIPLEYRIITSDGIIKTVWGEAGELIRDKNNKPFLLAGIIQDITDRKKNEEAIRKLEKAIESTQASIVITDFDGNIEYANTYFRKNTGYMASEYLGKNPRILQTGYHTKEFYKEMWDIIKSGNIWEGEFYNKKKDGSFYWETAIISPILDEKGQIKNFVAVKFDITDKKKITSELILAKEHAEESDRLKTAFLQNLSHEIRTPLNAILGFSEVIVKYYNDKPKIEYFSNIIIQRGNDLLEMINGILDIAKIESGQIPVYKQTYNLYHLFLELEVIFSEHKTRFHKDNVNLIIAAHCKQDKINIITDPGKLKQIFINLINNAFKFTDKGKIEIGYTIEESKIIFYVSDTGIGIPKDKQNFIFKRFTQINEDKSKIIGGTGLGLSIVKGLIELLEGKIWLDSDPGNGSTFFFSLPFNSPVTDKNDNKTEQKINTFELPDKTVLIVEDDPFNIEYLKEVLSDTKIKIIVAQTGNDAIDSANKYDIDIILMDLGLPDMNGIEATLQILAIKPEMKIIAQTAYASPIDKVKASEAGCIDYISKPLKRDLLLQKIRTALNPL